MASTKGYSTRVALTLLINGMQLSVSHVGNSGIMVADACEPLPACNAILVVNIDERTEKHSIFLPDGLPGPGKFVPFF